MAWWSIGSAAPNPQGFTSAHQHWRYVTPQSLPQSDGILREIFDLRLPLSFTLDDCATLAEILCDEIRATVAVAQ